MCNYSEGVREAVWEEVQAELDAKDAELEAKDAALEAKDAIIDAQNAELVASKSYVKELEAKLARLTQSASNSQ